MANLPAVLASLVLVITQSSVESCQLPELIPLQLVLTFGDRGSLVTSQYSSLDAKGKMEATELTVSMTL